MKRYRSKFIIASAVALWLTHVLVVASLGTTHGGALSSDLIQLVLGVMLLPVAFRAAIRSRGVGCNYWNITALAYTLLVAAQFLAVFQDLSPKYTLPQGMTLLFSFWSAALGMTLLVDPESGAARIDPLTYLGFIQGILFLMAAYFYFVLPSLSDNSGDLAFSLRTPYAIYNISVAAAFLFRSWLATSVGAKTFLRSMGLFMLASTLVDIFYYYGPGRSLQTGSWFDLLWSGLLIIPLVIAETWDDSEITERTDNPRAAAHNQLLTQSFSLIFPVLIVIMSLRIAQQRLVLASTILLTSLASSSARLLLTQKRLLAAQEALRREATHDGLTSLWNHAAILDILDRELLRAQRGNSPVGVMMIDIDKFKSVNDFYGHVAGDAVLKTLAREISNELRSYDSLGRYGGEEFLVVTPGCDIGACAQLAERVRDHVAKHSTPIRGGSMIPVTISVGVAASSQSVFSSEPLVQRADAALYQAKGAGRNRVESLTPAAPAF